MTGFINTGLALMLITLVAEAITTNSGPRRALTEGQATFARGLAIVLALAISGALWDRLS